MNSSGDNLAGRALAELGPLRLAQTVHSIIYVPPQHQVRGAVAPNGLELEHHLPGRIGLHAHLGQGRARDVAAQVFRHLAVVGSGTPLPLQTGSDRATGTLTVPARTALGYVLPLRR